MNEPTQWNDSLRIGHDHIDRQHRRLFAITEELRQSIQNRKKVSGTLSCLDKLLDYAATHFTDEEKLMQSIGYARFDIQKAAHGEFMNHVNAFMEALDAGDVPYDEMAKFLEDWLIGHISTEDRLIPVSDRK